MPQTITNNAHIGYQYETSNKTVNVETQTNYVTTSITQNCVNILKTSNKDYFGPNDQITYNLFISNNSNSTIYNVELLESLNEFTNYIPKSSTITLSNGTTKKILESNNSLDSCRPIVGNIINDNENKNKFGFKLNNINPNENILISFSTKVENNDEIPESIASSATLYYSLKSDKIQTLSVSSNTNIINKAYALLNVTKSVDKSVAICGDSITYTINLSNEGNINATNVHIKDTLPCNFKLKSINFLIADLPYNIDYNLDETNTLKIPAKDLDTSLCIPANSNDNVLKINGIII